MFLFDNRITKTFRFRNEWGELVEVTIRIPIPQPTDQELQEILQTTVLRQRTDE